MLDGALASCEERGKRALAAEALDDAFGGVELFPIHAVEDNEIFVTGMRRGLPAEPPARRSVRLRARDAVDRAEVQPVEVPRRRAGARRGERRCETLAFNFGRPTAFFAVMLARRSRVGASVMRSVAP